MEAIEFCDWNIHLAIKLLKIKIAVGTGSEVSFEECRREVERADGDVVKAASVLVMRNKNSTEAYFYLFYFSLEQEEKLHRRKYT